LEITEETKIEGGRARPYALRQPAHPDASTHEHTHARTHTHERTRTHARSGEGWSTGGNHFGICVAAAAAICATRRSMPAGSSLRFDPCVVVRWRSSCSATRRTKCCTGTACGGWAEREPCRRDSGESVIDPAREREAGVPACLDKGLYGLPLSWGLAGRSLEDCRKKGLLDRPLSSGGIGRGLDRRGVEARLAGCGGCRDGPSADGWLKHAMKAGCSLGGGFGVSSAPADVATTVCAASPSLSCAFM